MSIANTSFFYAYQNTLGLTYARGFEETYNPASTLQTFVGARQLFLGNMSTTDVTNGLTVVNAHLSAENTYSNAALGNTKTVSQQLNNFFTNTYGVPLRDNFNSLTPTQVVAWESSFKEAWYQANTQELVQQIGFATWNGTGFVMYPAFSGITNVQNTSGIAATSGNNITVFGQSPISNFAMPNDLIVASVSSSLPSSAVFSVSTTVVTGYANTNTLVLSGPIGSATSLFAFRQLKNPEYLEFRFATSGVTGLAATYIASDIILSVTLNNGITTNVTVGAANTTGRVNVGVYNNTTYKTTGISTIALASGTVASFGTQQSVEVWVKSTY